MPWRDDWREGERSDLWLARPSSGERLRHVIGMRPVRTVAEWESIEYRTLDDGRRLTLRPASHIPGGAAWTPPGRDAPPAPPPRGFGATAAICARVIAASARHAAQSES